MQKISRLINKYETTRANLVYRNRRVRQLVWATLIALSVVLLSNLFNDRDSASVFILGGAIIIIALASQGLQKHQSNLLAWILLWTITIAITQLMIFNGGLKDSAVLAYPGVLIYAAMIGSARLFISLAAFVFLSLAGVGYASVTGLIESHSRPPTWTTALDLVVITAAIAYSAWLLVSDLNIVFKRLERENKRAKASEDKIEHIANHDDLTGLPNITLCKDRFYQSLARARRRSSKVAVMILDLDDFKSINDSLGHRAGDELLKGIARCLQLTVRANDTVSRLGGDEFTVILESIPDDDAVVGVASKILKNVSQNFLVRHKGIGSSCSLGIAMAPEDGRDFNALRRKAELAMYKAKEAGRNTFRFYDEEMNEHIQEHIALVSGLRRAIETQQLRLFFQPKFQLPNEKLVGAEALIRWFKPDGQAVLPSKFIPLAETSGLIVDIGQWVLYESCRQCKKWHDSGHSEMSVAVNLSCIQFRQGDLASIVKDALTAADLPPNALELELTEYLLIDDSSNIKSQIQSLREMGISIAIDDFGTGYSNLGYLHKFEIETLKIDQSFVLNLLEYKEDAAIVQAILQMAKSLGLKTVAEGVEDAQTLKFLKELACDYYQGFYGSEPLDEDEFIEYITEYSQRSDRAVTLVS